jgi:hypothetical protein
MYTQLGHTLTNILGGTHFHENKAVGQIMTTKIRKVTNKINDNTMIRYEKLFFVNI